MVELEVIEDAPAAAAALDPVRARLLSALREPASAAGVAARLGLPRQRVGYHLGALERHGLIEEVEQRRHGGLVERIFAATAASYVVAPGSLAPPDPAAVRDRLSARFVIALAARAVREVAVLARTPGRVATLGIDAEIRFRSAAERAAFAEELAGAVTDLAARYHDERAPDGRPHRLVAALHPIPTDHEEEPNHDQ